jgi:hypothetical protein
MIAALFNRESQDVNAKKLRPGINYVKVATNVREPIDLDQAASRFPAVSGPASRKCALASGSVIRNIAPPLSRFSATM